MTRSGSNGLHGSAFEFYRNGAIDANDYFAVGDLAGENGYRASDFGGTLGGPLHWPGAKTERERRFWFVSYEGLFIDQPTPPTNLLAPPCELFTQTAPQILPVLQDFGCGGSEITARGGQPTGLAFQQLPGNSFPSHANAISARLDDAWSPKLRVFVRYGATPSYGEDLQQLAYNATSEDSQDITFGLDSQLSSGATEAFRVGYLRSSNDVSTTPLIVRNGVPYTLGPLLQLNQAVGALAPSSSVRSDVLIDVPGAGASEIAQDQTSSSASQWNLRDSFVWQLGHHSLTLGLDEQHISSAYTPAALSVQADFFSRASLVSNQAPLIVVTQNRQERALIQQFSAFANDTWRVAPSFTLSLGIRWAVNPAPHGSAGLDAFALRGDVHQPQTLELAPRGTPLWSTTWANLAPRFGAAWVLNNDPSHELVLRAGAGVFFDTADQPGLEAFSGLGFAQSVDFSGAALPVTQTQLSLAATSAQTYAGTHALLFPAHLQLPYSLEWDVAAERAFGRSQTLTLSYVAAADRRLLEEQRQNVTALNPQFGDVSYFPAGLTSNYNSLQVKFQRQIFRGVQALASYTWSHTLDYGSTDPAFPLRYSSSDLDVRHNLEASASWDFPGVAEHSFKSMLLGRWTFDGRLFARTAFPVNLFGNMFADPVDGAVFFSGVDRVSDRPLYLRGAEFPGGRILNAGPYSSSPAFALPSGTAPGDAPRNLLRGFDELQVNFGGTRHFQLTRGLAMQFGAEVYNIGNHPNFGYIDPVLTDALFGQAIRMLNESYGSTGAVFQQGGPRTIQVSLRLAF